MNKLLEHECKLPASIVKFKRFVELHDMLKLDVTGGIKHLRMWISKEL